METPAAFIQNKFQDEVCTFYDALLLAVFLLKRRKSELLRSFRFTIRNGHFTSAANQRLQSWNSLKLMVTSQSINEIITWLSFFYCLLMKKRKWLFGVMKLPFNSPGVVCLPPPHAGRPPTPEVYNRFPNSLLILPFNKQVYKFFFLPSLLIFPPTHTHSHHVWSRKGRQGSR